MINKLSQIQSAKISNSIPTMINSSLPVIIKVLEQTRFNRYNIKFGTKTISTTSYKDLEVGSEYYANIGSQSGGMISINSLIKREIINLKNKNEKLNQENNKLTTYLKLILEAIKTFFRELLLFGNDKVKQATTKEIKYYYDNKDFTKRDVIDIAKDTNKEDDLFSYIDYNKQKNKDNFDLSL